MQSPLIVHPDYTPTEAVYGFIGKNLKLAKHEYRGREQHAQENRNKVLEALNIKNSKLSLLKQIHSNKCVLINAHSQLQEEPEADGQVTNARGLVLGIQTADCVPIIFIDEKNKVIGAAHAGWKGALSGIISNTIATMKNLGAKEEEINTIIGPCIHQNSYEVSYDLMEKFLQETKDNTQFFSPCQLASTLKDENSYCHPSGSWDDIERVGTAQHNFHGNDSACGMMLKPNKYLFNLPGYVRMKLQLCDLNRIFDVNMDTMRDEENFFSYRRSTLRNEKLDGHILSVVGLKFD